MGSVAPVHQALSAQPCESLSSVRASGDKQLPVIEVRAAEGRVLKGTPQRGDLVRGPSKRLPGRHRADSYRKKRRVFRLAKNTGLFGISFPGGLEFMQMNPAREEGF